MAKQLQVHVCAGVRPYQGARYTLLQSSSFHTHPSQSGNNPHICQVFMTNTRITANFYPSTFGNDIPTYLQESVSSSPSPYATSGPPINRLLHIYTINSTVAMAFLGMRTFAKKWPTPVCELPPRISTTMGCDEGLNCPEAVGGLDSGSGCVC